MISSTVKRNDHHSLEHRFNSFSIDNNNNNNNNHTQETINGSTVGEYFGTIINK